MFSDDHVEFSAARRRFLQRRPVCATVWVGVTREDESVCSLDLAVICSRDFARSEIQDSSVARNLAPSSSLPDELRKLRSNLRSVLYDRRITDSHFYLSSRLQHMSSHFSVDNFPSDLFPSYFEVPRPWCMYMTLPDGPTHLSTPQVFP